jgi:hypothetical protein
LTTTAVHLKGEPRFLALEKGVDSIKPDRRADPRKGGAGPLNMMLNFIPFIPG